MLHISRKLLNRVKTSLIFFSWRSRCKQDWSLYLGLPQIVFNPKRLQLRLLSTKNVFKSQPFLRV